jgi:hypothetical protein
MDYDFSTNEYQQLEVVFSTGHEAIGSLLTEDIGQNSEAINALLAIIDQLEAREIYQHEQKGRHFLLTLTRDQVEVSAHILILDEGEEKPESTDFYDDELRAECGLNDFKQVLLAWREFLAL